MTTDERLAAYFADRPPAVERDVGRRRWRRTEALMANVQEVLDKFDGNMSTRQLYYQLVSRGNVENSPRSAERVQRLLVAMRRDGDVPYERIVDRGRAKHHQQGWDGVEDLMHSVRSAYRRDLWASQSVIPMIACEKAALEGVVGEIADEFGVALWTQRGFASESFAFEWAEEIIELTNSSKQVTIAYLGDFDPSGLEIERTTKQKLSLHGAEFQWTRLGLLHEDFDRFELVNVPVKTTDSRSRRYLETFGNRAAELDALPPDELGRRIREFIEAHIDREQWDGLKVVERLEKESLRLVAGNWDAALEGARGAA